MKCRFEHDGDCCNSGAAQYMCKCKQPCDTIIPLTNADRIRAMSDEELAEFLEDLYCHAWNYGASDRDDDVDYFNWLKQPAEV